MFTEKELKMMSMKIKGHSNKDIAAEMNVSEPDVSQTLARMRSKITSVKDSVALLTQIGILHEGPKLVLTEKGREFSKKLETEFKKMYTVNTCEVKLQPHMFGKQVFGSQTWLTNIYGEKPFRRNNSPVIIMDKTAYTENAVVSG